MLGDLSVSLLVGVVGDDKEKIETREKRVGKSNVPVRIFVNIVLVDQRNPDVGAYVLTWP
jgi:hypothetical protein